MDLKKLERLTVYEYVLESKDLNEALDRLTNIAIDTEDDELFKYTWDLRDMVIDMKEILWK